MNPTPTARVLQTEHGRDLVLTRRFNAPIDDVWASITESERTARWFVSWSGDARPGATITCRMVMEEGQPESQMTIDACEPPHHLAVTSTDEYGTWHLEARLHAAGGVTTLELVQHVGDDINLGEVGPGWEYYLDMLVASRDGSPRPNFDDYYPAQQAYFEALASN
jgi:uncharacterized protein YndB with AHSA1/START domain